MEYMGGGIAAIPVTPPRGTFPRWRRASPHLPGRWSSDAGGDGSLREGEEGREQPTDVAPVVVGQESGVFYIDFLYVVLEVEKNPTQDFPVVGKCLLISCGVSRW